MKKDALVEAKLRAEIFLSQVVLTLIDVRRVESPSFQVTNIIPTQKFSKAARELRTALLKLGRMPNA